MFLAEKVVTYRSSLIVVRLQNDNCSQVGSRIVSKGGGGGFLKSFSKFLSTFFRSTKAVKRPCFG